MASWLMTLAWARMGEGWTQSESVLASARLALRTVGPIHGTEGADGGLIACPGSSETGAKAPGSLQEPRSGSKGTQGGDRASKASGAGLRPRGGGGRCRVPQGAGRRALTLCQRTWPSAGHGGPQRKGERTVASRTGDK